MNKSKVHVNPYFDVTAWSCRNLEWCGPEEKTVEVRHSHAQLPILYHHFGCVCPSYESLSYIHQVSRGRTILDIGSGNGYWTYMLRRFESNPKKKLTVIAVDNGLSEWRTVWIGDTIEADGHKWLQQNSGGKDGVLLLVYPVVGLHFTSKIIKAYSKLNTNDDAEDRLIVLQRALPSSQRVRRMQVASRRSPRRPLQIGWPGKCQIGKRYCRYRCRHSRRKTKHCSYLRRKHEADAAWYRRVHILGVSDRGRNQNTKHTAQGSAIMQVQASCHMRILISM